MAADSSKPWEDFAPAGKSPSGGQSEKPWEDFGGETKPEPKGFAGHARDLGISALQGAIGVPEMAVGLADIPTGGAVGKFLENKDGAVGFRPKQAREFLDTLKTDATQQQKKEFEQADGVMGKAGYALSNPSLISNAVAESLPVMGAGGLIGRGVMAAAPKLGAAVAAGAGEGIAAAGSTAEQIRQETKDGELTAGQSALALGAGAATGAFGVAGAKVAKKLGIADADALLVQGAKGMAADAAQQAAMKSIPRKVIEGAIAEGFLEELPQSASEQIIQNIALDRPWSDGVESSVVLGVLSGMAMGGGATLVQGSAQRKTADGAPAGEQNAPQDAPTLALPAPTYTGTPNDQVLQAEAERANAVAEAEARAAGIYQQRADFEAAKQGQPEQPPVNAGLELVRQAYAAQLDALQQQEQDQAAVPQSSPPDGRAALEAQAAQAQAQREADRAVMGPDDEILQSTGAVEPPHRAMGIDPAAGPLSAGAAIAVDTGVAGQMQAAAQAVTAQDAAPQAAGPLSGAAQDAGTRFVAGEKWSKPGRSGYVIDRVSDDGKMAIARDGDSTFTIGLDVETANGWKPEGRDLGAAQQDPAAAWNSMSTPERAAVAGRVGLPPVIANNIPRTGWEGLNSDLQARISKAMAPATPATAPPIEGADLGNGWAKFSPESGTAGVPRAEMPQIKAEHRGAMTNFMNARGVTHVAEEVPADSLRPTQAEFSPEKVRKAAGFKGGERSILVSADNYVLDGHHQWLAKRDNGEPVKVIRLNAPIADLIPMAREFPSSTTDSGADAGSARDDAAVFPARAVVAGPAAAVGQARPFRPKNLVQLVREAGGVSIDRKADINQDSRTVGVFRKGGMDLDGLAELLQQNGFMTDADVTDTTSGAERAAELLRAALAGERVLSMNDTDEAMGRDAEAQYRDEIRRKASEYGIRTTFRPFGDVEREVLARDGELAPEDVGAYDYNEASIEEQDAFDAIDALIDSAPQLSPMEALQALGFTEDEIRAEIENAGSKGSAGKADAGAAQERATNDRQGAQDEAAGSALESYTEQDLAARDEAQRLAEESRAKAERDADNKSRADADRDTFTLTGSDRAADVMAAQGQGGLFDAPAAANQEPIKNETRANAGPAPADRDSDQEPIKNPAPAVGNAPSPLEALFSDLNSDSTRKANKAKKAAAKLPEAARIEYVQANFHDILMQMMEAGALEVNGFATLTEDNAPCL